MLYARSMNKGYIKIGKLIQTPSLPSLELGLRLKVDCWMVISNEGGGLANQLVAPKSQGQHAFKKLPFSCRVVSFG